jgi:UDP-2,3-diacylglucosamine hydrolase
LKEEKNIYFASDFHLGLPAGSNPIDREKRVVKWLNSITPEAKEIYLLGDIFDFWWEYKLVVPKGFTRFLGTIAAITDSGIPVHFFAGNHDMWIGKYLSNECGVAIHSDPLFASFNGKNFYLAHGEGLGTKYIGYKTFYFQEQTSSGVILCTSSFNWSRNRSQMVAEQQNWEGNLHRLSG